MPSSSSQTVSRTVADIPNTPTFTKRAGGGSPGTRTAARWLVPGSLLLMLLILKIVYVFDLRIDSDETQHLHVVWGWANGMLPYRDLFDNHSPLFQFLCAPLFRSLGERADIVVPMRAAVLPLYLLCLWIVYRSGEILFSRTTALWAALIAGAFPMFFIKTSEFRTDDLWAVFWLLSVYLLIRRPFNDWSALAFGLAVGASFATSLKTTALVLGLMIGVGATLLLKSSTTPKLVWQTIARRGGLILGGALLLPAVIVAFFGVKGALPQLYYCTVQHNVVPHSFSWLHLLKSLPRVLSFFIVTAAAGWIACRNCEDQWRRDRIILLTASLLGYFIVLGSIWSIVQPQDFTPVAPLAALLTAAALATSRRPNFRVLAPPVVVLLGIVALIAADPPRGDALVKKEAMISTVLDLTTPNDFVMDAKGETVYRRRPFYYVLEGLSSRRLAKGWIKDDIPERLIETHAPIATLVRMPPKARDFIRDNYLPIAFRTRVLGKMLKQENDPSAGGTCEFDIAVPASYVLVTETPTIGATLDGKDAASPQYLESGKHHAVLPAASGRVAVVWARAIEKRFSPFAAVPPDDLGAQD